SYVGRNMTQIKTRGIALVTIAAVMLVGETTVSLAPMNLIATSGSSGDDRESATKLTINQRR
ncbi:MAG: hypothetical protein WBX01_05525, partial [Nitrososphaeraceae archaeon]